VVVGMNRVAAVRPNACDWKALVVVVVVDPWRISTTNATLTTRQEAEAEHSIIIMMVENRHVSSLAMFGFRSENSTAIFCEPTCVREISKKEEYKRNKSSSLARGQSGIARYSNKKKED
jgi:hypothetical protein